MTTRSRLKAKLIAAGFLAAFGTSVFTVIYTGLRVEAPKTELAAGLPSAALAINEPAFVNLSFTAGSSYDDVILQLDLPAGVELVGRAGQVSIRWKTRLEPGRNFLPLELVARAPVSGQLIARLRHGDQQKVFRVFVSAEDDDGR